MWEERGPEAVVEMPFQPTVVIPLQRVHGSNQHVSHLECAQQSMPLYRSTAGKRPLHRALGAH